jgi:hypothetical protein
VAQLFQVLSLMAAPAVILLTVRYLIVRQNRPAAPGEAETVSPEPLLSVRRRR